eukprot:CAMPEP_0115855130 /NCGR_PEP_ID=MMETSP0287-20121206/14386_1 /TAXON_ID=412157 /ORGANISM="Chrysochromulina rotalis, Strain UIO044" /LENGTH=54 /DNA_ID=CAMNT_0003309279 /DNA_START=523 /DNA_END=684 /DNA_ORIENTATION=-
MWIKPVLSSAACSPAPRSRPWPRSENDLALHWRVYSYCQTMRFVTRHWRMYVIL